MNKKNKFIVGTVAIASAFALAAVINAGLSNDANAQRQAPSYQQQATGSENIRLAKLDGATARSVLFDIFHGKDQQASLRVNGLTHPIDNSPMSIDLTDERFTLSELQNTEYLGYLSQIVDTAIRSAPLEGGPPVLMPVGVHDLSTLQRLIGKTLMTDEGTAERTAHAKALDMAFNALFPQAEHGDLVQEQEPNTIDAKVQAQINALTTSTENRNLETGDTVEMGRHLATYRLTQDQIATITAKGDGSLIYNYRALDINTGEVGGLTKDGLSADNPNPITLKIYRVEGDYWNFVIEGKRDGGETFYDVVHHNSLTWITSPIEKFGIENIKDQQSTSRVRCPNFGPTPRCGG